MTMTIAEHERILETIERADAEGALRAAASEHVNLLGDGMADFIAAVPMAMFEEGGV
jgi:DNA-binding GntR family transcriptional regulator